MLGNTPGPWVHTPNATKDGSEIQQASTGSLIAEVFHDNIDGEKNARLIALAPEMLEVIEDTWTKGCTATRERARAVMVKMHGEVPR